MLIAKKLQNLSNFGMRLVRTHKPIVDDLPSAIDRDLMPTIEREAREWARFNTDRQATQWLSAHSAEFLQSTAMSDAYIMSLPEYGVAYQWYSTVRRTIESLVADLPSQQQSLPIGGPQ